MAVCNRQQTRFAKNFLPVLLGVAIAALMGCAVAEVPAAPDDDPVLQMGQQVYASACRSCHGGDGGGGSSPALNSGLTEKYPVKVDQVLVVAEGKGGMPGFAGRLSDEEIDAVVDYTREVLSASQG